MRGNQGTGEQRGNVPIEDRRSTHRSLSRRAIPFRNRDRSPFENLRQPGTGHPGRCFWRLTRPSVLSRPLVHRLNIEVRRTLDALCFRRSHSIHK